MLGNAIQLAGCLLPFVLLFNLDKFLKSKKYVAFMTRIAAFTAVTSLEPETKMEIFRMYREQLTKYEAAWYGAWSAGYIIIGYIIATLELDWPINTLLCRLFIFVLITFVLVFLACGICSSATKKYADKEKIYGNKAI
ncbi:hypothetical protein [Bacillus sp. FJAT-28004]|uniref:hypothetical protein n=1 Tax=Bacillus sp. FJAT-28004 TaxID=1679165 RepID=UPI0006B55A32|nr:hypothetical protein [Bacillus sp. FJAT-28004]